MTGLSANAVIRKMWKECPLCQERMRQEGLEDEEALHGYFMARMSKYVQSKGKEAMGWCRCGRFVIRPLWMYLNGSAWWCVRIRYRWTAVIIYCRMAGWFRCDGSDVRIYQKGCESISKRRK